MRKLLLISALITSYSIIVKAQSNTDVIKNNLINTKNGSIVVINNIDTSKFKIFIYMSNDKMNLTQDDRIISIGNTIFQLLLVDEKPIGPPNNLGTLTKFAKNELKYLADSVYRQSLKSNSEIIDRQKTSLNTTSIFWYYETPPNFQSQVKNHLYISFSYKGYIMGVYMPQFENQDFNNTKQLLMNVFNSMVITDENITLETLCNYIKN